MLPPTAGTHKLLSRCTIFFPDVEVADFAARILGLTLTADPHCKFHCTACVQQPPSLLIQFSTRRFLAESSALFLNCVLKGFRKYSQRSDYVMFGHFPGPGIHSHKLGEQVNLFTEVFQPHVHLQLEASFLMKMDA